MDLRQISDSCCTKTLSAHEVELTFGRVWAAHPEVMEALRETGHAWSPSTALPLALRPRHGDQMDIVDKARRSAMMAGIRGKDTRPELVVRKAVHALGYRFRLHRRDLPGSPDLLFPARKKAIFVHGCYWHRHEGCRYATQPKSNAEFWLEKFEKNQARDRRVMTELVAGGWDPMVIWECETRDAKVLNDRIASHLGQRGDDDHQG